MNHSIFDSIDQLKIFLEENPDSLAFSHLAARLIDDGDYQEAINTCEMGLSKHPQYSFGHFILGTAHYHLKNYTDAKKALEKSLAYDPSNPRAWEILSAINEILNLNDDAKDSNLQSYLYDSLREDASPQFIGDSGTAFSESGNEEQEDTLPAAETDEPPQAPRDAEEILDSMAAEGEEEFDFDKALNEVFQDKESGDLTKESEVAGETGLDEIEEKDLDGEKAPSEMVSADEFTSAIESFFDAHEDQAKDEQSDSQPGRTFEVTDETSKEEMVQPEDDLDEAEAEHEETDQFQDETSEMEEITFDDLPSLEEMDLPEESKRGHTGEEKPQDETEELLREGLSEEFAAEELIDEQSPEPEETGPEVIKTEESNSDDELLDFTSFVSDIIQETEEDQPQVSEIEHEKTTDTGKTNEIPREETRREFSIDDDFESLEPLESPDNAEISPEVEEFPKEEDFNIPDVDTGEPDHPAADIQMEASPEEATSSDEASKFTKPPILSPTLGEIYIAQGRFDEAIGVFKQLLAKDPENSRYQRKIEDLKSIIAKKKLGS